MYYIWETFTSNQGQSFTSYSLTQVKLCVEGYVIITKFIYLLFSIKYTLHIYFNVTLNLYFTTCRYFIFL